VKAPTLLKLPENLFPEQEDRDHQFRLTAVICHVYTSDKKRLRKKKKCLPDHWISYREEMDGNQRSMRKYNDETVSLHSKLQEYVGGRLLVYARVAQNRTQLVLTL
jgi:hypothetical protein